MIMGEIKVVQYPIRITNFWTDFLTFYRDFNGGMFDDNDFEVMVKELQNIKGEENMDRMKAISVLVELMMEEAVNQGLDSLSYSVDMIRVGDNIILAYAYQTY